MTSKLDNHLGANKPSDNPNLNSAKPEVLRGWKTKLLVLLLCGISFFAGWKAYQARQANACIQLGGQMVAHGQVSICQGVAL
ncbi:hypothetical protein [Psychrobacter sp. I-STPA10]|uniref:hypothetical protein n=1 Tax=Psychrobacter sp. I-STPA10 TaxID=2585769 RepID=UPI001E2BAF44|nr:hypothetical protein [Psychrobacter sp. I-STPA10]